MGTVPGVFGTGGEMGTGANFHSACWGGRVPRAWPEEETRGPPFSTCRIRVGFTHTVKTWRHG